MGTLICKVELDKVKGITVTVDNEDGKITQTVTMDGTTLTIKVKGDKETSTYEQKQDSIKIKVKEYLLEAETITCKSTKATLHDSKDTFTQTSSKAMKIETQDKLDIKATMDASFKAQNINIEAQMKLGVKAPMGISMETSGGEFKVSALKLAVHGEGCGSLLRAASNVALAVDGAPCSDTGSERETAASPGMQIFSQTRNAMSAARSTVVPGRASLGGVTRASRIVLPS